MIEERRRFGFGRLLLIVMVAMVIVAASGIFPFRQLIAQGRSVDLAQQKLDALVEENMRLEQRVAALQSPQEVERLAREQFGLVMPGEIAYVAVVPDGGEPTPVRPATAEFEETTPWWETFWNFITGSDLTADG